MKATLREMCNNNYNNVLIKVQKIVNIILCIDSVVYVSLRKGKKKEIMTLLWKNRE